LKHSKDLKHTIERSEVKQAIVMAAQPEEIPPVEEMVQAAVEEFKVTFGSDPNVAAAAPGRVNLIGEHTDYNAGFVLPMALPLVTVVVGKENNLPKICRVKTLSQGFSPSKVEFSLEGLEPGQPAWANYVKGAIAKFHGSSGLTGFDCVITSSVPLGGGVSSSASLEVAMYTFLEELTHSPAKGEREKALACQAAEHQFAGMPCGIMDQFISVMAKHSQAVLIDCRDMSIRLVKMEDPELAVLITNSNVKHQLTGSEYPDRRRACEEAARIMGKPSLREVSLAELEQQKNKFGEEMYRRVRHVVTEIARTEQAADKMEKGQYEEVGKLMLDSHNSLRDDYEVSCPELDELVEAAIGAEGVYGSRMTGGGFGGCTVTLLKKTVVSSTIEHIAKKYSGKATFYVCSASMGARPIKL